MKTVPYFLLLMLCSCVAPTKTTTIQRSTVGNTNLSNSEFEKLMSIDALDKDQRAAEAATQFLNDDLENANAAVLFRNQSQCNTIISVSGANYYKKLPVPKGGINYLILKKGSYHFSSTLCRAQYRSSKILSESIEISISE